MPSSDQCVEGRLDLAQAAFDALRAAWVFRLSEQRLTCQPGGRQHPPGGSSCQQGSCRIAASEQYPGQRVPAQLVMRESGRTCQGLSAAVLSSPSCRNPPTATASQRQASSMGAPPDSSRAASVRSTCSRASGRPWSRCSCLRTSPAQICCMASTSLKWQAGHLAPDKEVDDDEPAEQVPRPAFAGQAGKLREPGRDLLQLALAQARDGCSVISSPICAAIRSLTTSQPSAALIATTFTPLARAALTR